MDTLAATPLPGLARIQRRQWLLMGVWSALIAASLFWGILQERQQIHSLAEQEARANFKKDQAFRLWATRHGGVYVPVNDRTPSNPYLAHLPHRDVRTDSGQQLTLMNPAYMLRQLMEEFQELYGVKGDITSLQPLNPENRPDPWKDRPCWPSSMVSAR